MQRKTEKLILKIWEGTGGNWGFGFNLDIYRQGGYQGKQGEF
jgi:hypothetical protein